MAYHRITRSIVGAVLGLTVVASSASGHGPIPEQITAITKRIEKDPDNAALILRRGELHRVNRSWSAALADYTRVASLDPELPVVKLCLGRMLLEAGWPRAARIPLDRFLADQPDHVGGLVVRARVLAKLGDGIAAAKDYTRALGSLGDRQRPLPEYYIERARALAGEGDAHVEAALRGLDQGIKQLGPLVTLELYAIELELSLKRYDAALARLNRIIAQSRRKERWLTRRGDILEQAGRGGEARAAYADALAALRSASRYRRKARTTQTLEAKLLAQLRKEEGR